MNEPCETTLDTRRGIGAVSNNRPHTVDDTTFTCTRLERVL
jgi:hypothetical protein